MNVQGPARGGREHLRVLLDTDLVVVGGGLSGVCCAITAAREGLRVVLVQDRPVLGGNASSEIRMWVVGATSHMGNNNRWAREGGVIDEILVENLWRNPGGNAIVLDSLLLEKVLDEPRITLLLNTAADAVEMDENRLRSLDGYCSQNQTMYRITAPFYCDASGDGILGFLSGASFRMGSEGRAEFGEPLAEEEPGTYLLGHSLYFYSRDTGRPVKYTPPSFALMDISPILRYRELKVTDYGQRLWWLEYGGMLDTIHDAEKIKWELWRLAYGVWNHIKNSGEYPEAANLALDWMGMIPGRRESRRFEGDYMLRQQDIVEQRTHADAVSYGGWAIDIHPPEGVYSKGAPCTQWHAKGIYAIPYRTMYSRDVANLFLTGRLISATHIAFGSIRVMATCAHNGQAAGMAAVLCMEENLSPRDLADEPYISRLQQRLLRSGQYIPGIINNDPEDLAKLATVTASSTLKLASTNAAKDKWMALDHDCAVLLPLQAAQFPSFAVAVDGLGKSTLVAELWKSSKPGNFTPEILLASTSACISAGVSSATLAFTGELEEDAYVFLILRSNPSLQIGLTEEHIPGIMTVHHTMNASVAKSAVQQPPAGSGIDSFAFWLPKRQPDRREIALTIDPPLCVFEASQVIRGASRPVNSVNGWVPAIDDPVPTLWLRWRKQQRIRTIQIIFDTDFDHPMETLLMTHAELAMPACIRRFRILDATGTVIAQVEENHHTRCRITLPVEVITDAISLEILESWGALPAIYEVRCYSKELTPANY